MEYILNCSVPVAFDNPAPPPMHIKQKDPAQSE